ncbi:serine hydrolase [Flavobacterium sp. NKUCC04_CG]|uniref:serine hydrolase domain-containing protein n=1 Tax=Flavobacterium sp. NKUCC04_CG TaxID=2842121 RepID=UPI001C5A7B65|nr:serine hydrolase [Flavobacterium sp. NKUCC04_CG]MBW3518915.1 beta-lactamase family protein [Flavobacterium sp. NKUCC04_CG]
MKKLFKILKIVIITLVAIVALMYIFKVDYLITAVRTVYFHGHKTAFLDDYKYFPNREIKKDIAQPWQMAIDYNTVPATERLEKTNKDLKTVAFMIIKNDSIWYESYYDGYDKDSKSNSFSMAKSVVSAALGKAIQEGKIKGLDQKLIDFLPELEGAYKDQVTVGDLSSMASGLDWDEQYYSPLSIVTRAYFDKDLRKVMMGLQIKNQPGQHFEYKSGDTELLAMVLEKAVKKPLADYVSEKFWQPMGAENDALWQLDHDGDGIEKAYCCIASNARDFARFGKLYKQYGKWEGQQLLDSAFVAKSIQPRFPESPQYGYGWWLNNYRNKHMFYMRGHLGQFVIVIPEDDIIIVRLGHLKGLETAEDAHSKDFYIYVDEAYQMLSKRK